MILSQLFELKLSHPELEDFVVNSNCSFCDSKNSLNDYFTKSQVLEPARVKVIFCIKCEHRLFFNNTNVIVDNRVRNKYTIEHVQFMQKHYHLRLYNSPSYWYESFLNEIKPSKGLIKKEYLNFKPEYSDVVKILNKLDSKVEKLLPLM